MTPEYITIHNTANDASAANEISYMTGNSESTSYHFAVDDKEVIQGFRWTGTLGILATVQTEPGTVSLSVLKSATASQAAHDTRKQRRWLSSLWRNFLKSAAGASTGSESIRTGMENTARTVF